MTQPDILNPEILLAHTEWLRFLARQLVQEQSAQDDLIQETYLQTLKSPPRDAGSIGPFMTKVMKRLASRRWGREQRRLEIEAGVAPNIGPATPQELADQLTTQRDLVDAVLTIKDTYRDVLILRFYEDLTPTEISKRLNRPLATVKSRLQRGIIKLREKMLSQYGGEDSLRRSLLPLAALAGLKPMRHIGWVSTLAAAKVAAVLAIVFIIGWGVKTAATESESSEALESSSLTPNDSFLEKNRQRPNRSIGPQPVIPPQTIKVEEKPQIPRNHVQVVDQNGAGVGNVAVGIYSRLRKKSELAWSGITKGKYGSVDLTSALRQIRENNECKLYTLTLGFPCFDSPSIVIEPKNGLGGPAQLKMPRTGSVLVKIFDADHRPFQSKAHLSCNGGSLALLRDEKLSGFLSTFESSASDAARIRIPHVGLGLALILTVQDEARRHPPTEVRIKGPTTPGEEIAVEVDLAPALPLVRGKIVFDNDLQGQPRTMQAIIVGEGPIKKRSAEDWKNGRFPFNKAVDIDINKDGTFEFIWQYGAAVEDPHKIVIAQDFAKDHRGVGITASAILSKMDKNSVFNVGTLETTVDPVLVSGMVVDDTNNPVAGALVSARVRGVTKTQMFGNPGRGCAASARTDAMGRFFMRGQVDSPSDQIRLTVKSKGHARLNGKSIKLPAKGITLTVDRLGEIKGSLALATPLDAWRISIRTVQDRETRLGKIRRTFRSRSRATTVEDGGIQRDGSFTLKGVKPGNCEVEISVGGRVVHTISSLVIQSGKTLETKELKNIKLDEDLQLVKVTLHDEEGRPLRGRSVYTTFVRQGRVSTQTSLVSTRLDETGSFMATDLRPGAKEIDLSVAGYTPITARVTDGRVSVNLEPGPAISLSMESFEKYVVDDQIIRVTLARRMSRSRGSNHRALYPLSKYSVNLEEGQATVHVCDKGSFSVRLDVLDARGHKVKEIFGIEPKVIKLEGASLSQILKIAAK